VIAYLIREPKQAKSFLEVFMEDYQWRGDVLVGLLAGLTAAEHVDMRGIRRFLPARGLRWFSPTNLRRLIVDDPASEKNERSKFEDPLHTVIVLDTKMVLGTDEEVSSAMREVLMRQDKEKKIAGFAGPGSYFSEHLLRDRFIKLYKAFPGDKLTSMSESAAKHFVGLQDLFTGVTDIVEVMQSLELEETPFFDLGLLRYVVCMMCKAVPVAEGEHFFFVARRYISLLDFRNQQSIHVAPAELELPIRSAGGEGLCCSSVVAVSQFPLLSVGPGSNRSPTTATASGCARRKDVTAAPLPSADQRSSRDSSASRAFYLIFQHFGYHLDQDDIEALFFHGTGSKGPQFGSVLGVLKCLFGKNSIFKRPAAVSCRLYPTLAQNLHGRVLIVDGELNPFFYEGDKRNHLLAKRHCLAILDGEISLPLLSEEHFVGDNENYCSTNEHRLPVKSILNLNSDGSFRRDKAGNIMGYFRQISRVYHVLLPAPTLPSCPPSLMIEKKQKRQLF